MLADSEIPDALCVLTFKWFDPEGRHNNLFVYTAEYVNKLRSMLRRHLSLPHELVCCTDDPAGLHPDIRIVPLPGEAKGLGSLNPKLYAFHPEAGVLFGRRVLMLDLDLVVLRNIDDLASRTEPFVAWSAPPNSRGRFNTSFVLMDGGAFPEVWRDFTPARLDVLRTGGYDGWEQDWVSHVVGERGAVIARAGEGIESYSANLFMPLPNSARIVFFNGRVSPGMAQCQQNSPWVTEHWK